MTTIEDRMKQLAHDRGPVVITCSDPCDSFTVWFYTHKLTGHSSETSDSLNAAMAAAERRTFGASFASHEHKEG
jgi:hypothetical protein